MRDEYWTRSALVPAAFAQYFSPREPGYQPIICSAVYIYGYGLSEGSKMILALDPTPTTFHTAAGDPRSSPALDNPTPGLGLQLWLMEVHLLGMTADAAGVVTVELEPRAGFEQVIFDLESVASSPHRSGSLLFRFLDSTGHEIEAPILRPVRASWEYGRAPAP